MTVTHTITLLQRAEVFAKRAHEGQLYGEEFPYHTHLRAVVEVLKRFGVTDENLLAAGWLHDTLEDTKVLVEDLLVFFNEDIADLVSRVTEPKGGNRKWRHAMTYPYIAGSARAITLKLADRIANVEAGGRKTQMYVKEYAEFKHALLGEGSLPLLHCDMWNHLDMLLADAALGATR